MVFAGSDLNTYSCIFSPLYVAIQKHCLPVVRLLIEHGASIYFDKPQYYHEVRDPISYAFFMNNKEYKTEPENIYQIKSLIEEKYYSSYQNQIISLNQKADLLNKTMEVVAVVYKEDPSWLLKEFLSSNIKLTIYNKGPNNHNTMHDLHPNCNVINITNKGYLGGTYLTHIVKNYYNLADITLFTQGDPRDVNSFLTFVRYFVDDLPKYCNNIIGKCSNTTFKAEIDFLNQTDWKSHPRYHDFEPVEYDWLEYIRKYMGEIDLSQSLKAIFGAVFAVSKENIHHRPIEYYQSLLLDFNYPKPKIDHLQERMWDYIFGPETIDTNL